MNLLLRLMWISIFSRFRKAVPVVGPCLTPFRCMVSDLDVLRHMNNGVYLSIMDLARVDLMIRADVYPQLNKKGWYPVVVAETIRFRKSLKLFEKFFVETKVLGWDEKAFILEQRFLRNEKCIAEAIVRARFLKKEGGTVSPLEILDLVQHPHQSPELPHWIQDWNKVQIN